jgi:hypothetical protein
MSSAAAPITRAGSPCSRAAAAARRASLAPLDRLICTGYSRATIIPALALGVAHVHGRPRERLQGSVPSTSSASASAIASARLATVAMIQVFVTIFTAALCRRGPSDHRRRHRGKERRARAPAPPPGPDASMMSSPCSAGAEPSTGASAIVTPWRSASAMSRSAASTPTVLHCTHTPRAPSRAGTHPVRRRLDGGGVRHHRHDQVGARRGGRRRRAHGDPVRLEPLGVDQREAPGRDLQAGRGGAARHGRAHDARAQHGDPGHRGGTTGSSTHGHRPSSAWMVTVLP